MIPLKLCLSDLACCRQNIESHRLKGKIFQNEELGEGCETPKFLRSVPKHAGLNSLTDTHPRTERLQNLTDHHQRESPEMERAVP
jgi:hypothetical protein